MNILANTLVGLVAFLHLGFFALEAYSWRRPLGLKVFRMTPDKAELTAPLAANQGLYNGFLAAGLIWSLISQDLARPLQIFFLSCVIIAGIFGAMTVSKKILMLQALPAALALVVVLLA